MSNFHFWDFGISNRLAIFENIFGENIVRETLCKDGPEIISAGGAILSVGKFAVIPFCSRCDSVPFQPQITRMR